jgi:heme/copper-type cytochrome/quinol oxidase subunit 2
MVILFIISLLIVTIFPIKFVIDINKNRSHYRPEGQTNNSVYDWLINIVSIIIVISLFVVFYFTIFV